MKPVKSLARRIRSLFDGRSVKSRRSRVRIAVSSCERLEQRQLLVVGATGIPNIVLPGNGFDGVVHLTSGTGEASGVLLEDGLHVLTAAHVVRGAGMITVNFNIFDHRGNPISVDVPIADQTEHPGFIFDPARVDLNDIAVLRLPEVAPAGAERFSLFDGSNEIGQIITIAGYGGTGTGVTGATTFDGQLRTGMNQISVFSPLARDFRIDFDGNGLDLFGDGNGLGAAESLNAPGDSGGPAFIGNQVAGIISRGSGGATDRRFNANGTYTRVSRYQEFIRGIQTDDGIDVVVNMANQPDGNDTFLDTIIIRPVGQELEILVNDNTVFSTAAVPDFGDHDLTLTDIQSIQIIGSNDGERIEFDERTGSLSGFSPFATGASSRTISLDLGAGSQELVMGHHTNLFNRHDVNGDGIVKPEDAIIIINYINENDTDRLAVAPYDNTTFLDVNRDGILVPLDVLLIFNHINSRSGRGAEGEAPPSFELGSVDFASLLDLNIDGDTYYQFQAANNGTLTIEALFSPSSENIVLELYNGENSPKLIASSLFSTDDRIDVEALAGERFILRVRGTNSDVDLRLTNLVNVSGSTVTVTGTAAADTLTVDTSGSTYAVTINGTTYSYTGSAVSSIAFNAGAGSDTADLTTGPARDDAFLYHDRYTITGSGYSLSGTDVEIKHARSTGGNDYAYLYDSSGNDRFVSRKEFSTLYGSGFSSSTYGFYSTNAYSNNGGRDRTSFYDSPEDDTYVARHDASYMYGSGYSNSAVGFDYVYAFAYRGGNDEAYFLDSAGDDRFVARGAIAYMRGAGYLTYQYGFDNVYLLGFYGGNDTLDLDETNYLFSYYGNWSLV